MTGEVGPEIGEKRLRLLRGKPLASRSRWLMWRLGYIVLLVVALIAILVLVDGIWLMIFLTVLAFAASVLPELLADLRYSKYVGEWEAANDTDAT